VQAEARTTLLLCCQRCLEAVRYELRAQTVLAVVAGLDEARLLPETYDPLLVSDRLIRPLDLIEDEILLALPQIPKHDMAECAGAAPGRGLDRVDDSNPFDVLADWKRRV
jgi:uncharacterized protein